MGGKGVGGTWQAPSREGPNPRSRRAHGLPGLHHSQKVGTYIPLNCTAARPRSWSLYYLLRYLGRVASDPSAGTATVVVWTQIK